MDVGVAYFGNRLFSFKAQGLNFSVRLKDGLRAIGILRRRDVGSLALGREWGRVHPLFLKFFLELQKVIFHEIYYSI